MGGRLEEEEKERNDWREILGRGKGWEKGREGRGNVCM